MDTTDNQPNTSKPSGETTKKDSSKFDSSEELYFSWYLEELKNAGYIIEYYREVEPFDLLQPVVFKWNKKLKTKEKEMEFNILREHIYTPDFKIIWDESARGIFVVTEGFTAESRANIPFVGQKLDEDSLVSYIEIKPIFDQNNMTRLFTINQKWVYDKVKIYVQKIIPIKLFKSTFVPKRYLRTDGGRAPRLIKFQIKKLKDFTDDNNI